MIFAIVGAIAFIALGVSCLIECFDTEEYDQQTACDCITPCGGEDTRDHRI